jgi:hypothetical protein
VDAGWVTHTATGADGQLGQLPLQPDDTQGYFRVIQLKVPLPPGPVGAELSAPAKPRPSIRRPAAGRKGAKYSTHYRLYLARVCVPTPTEIRFMFLLVGMRTE